MARCIRVPKTEGNEVRNALKKEGLLNIDFRIDSDEDALYIPIICGSYKEYDVIERELEPILHEETNYRMFFPEEIRDSLPNSFDNIGDITIVKIPDELLHMKREIGEAILKVSKNTRLVLMDSGVKGELRVRDLEPIAGSGPTETIHRESGVSMIIDPSKIYFNPRLATERERVASLVKDGETIIDMFAGIAPFPMIICRHARPKVVYAMDLNHVAVEYMKRNIESNRFTNIIAMEGDARELIKDLPYADRIIMNLPQMAEEFLLDALSRLNRNGTIHMHKIMERSTSDEECEKLMDRMYELGFDSSVREKHELKTYSPTASVYVLDITVS